MLLLQIFLASKVWHTRLLCPWAYCFRRAFARGCLEAQVLIAWLPFFNRLHFKEWKITSNSMCKHLQEWERVHASSSKDNASIPSVRTYCNHFFSILQHYVIPCFLNRVVFFAKVDWWTLGILTFELLSALIWLPTCHTLMLENASCFVVLENTRVRRWSALRCIRWGCTYDAWYVLIGSDGCCILISLIIPTDPI